MVGVVVRLHKVLKDVDESPRLVFREVSPHTRLQRSIESFDDAPFRLRVVSGKVMDAVLLQQSLNGPIQKFESLIYNVFGQPSVNVLFSAVTNDAADLFFSGTHQATFVKTSIIVRRKVIPSLSVFKFDRSRRSACHC